MGRFLYYFALSNGVKRLAYTLPPVTGLQLPHFLICPVMTLKVQGVLYMEKDLVNNEYAGFSPED